MSPDFIEYLKTHAGEPVDEKDRLSEEQTTELKNKLNTVIDMASSETFDINSAQPGVPVTPVNITDTETPDYSEYKAQASKTLLNAVAQNKLKKQKEAEKQKPMETRVKEYYISACLNNIATNFLEKHGFCMAAKEKRQIRRKLERNYGKPGYTPSKEDKQRIIDYLNMPSSEEQSREANPFNMSDRSTSQNISSLMSMI